MKNPLIAIGLIIILILVWAIALRNNDAHQNITISSGPDSVNTPSVRSPNENLAIISNKLDGENIEINRGIFAMHLGYINQEFGIGNSAASDVIYNAHTILLSNNIKQRLLETSNDLSNAKMKGNSSFTKAAILYTKMRLEGINRDTCVERLMADNGSVVNVNPSQPTESSKIESSNSGKIFETTNYTGLLHIYTIHGNKRIKLNCQLVGIGTLNGIFSRTLKRVEETLDERIILKNENITPIFIKALRDEGYTGSEPVLEYSTDN